MRKHKERWQCPNHMTSKIRNLFLGFYGACIVVGLILRVGFGLFWIGTEILGVGLSGMAVVYWLRRDHVAWLAEQERLAESEKGVSASDGNGETETVSDDVTV